MSGNLFLFIGPSGAGKTTIAERVLVELTTSTRAITHTTRARRPSEQDGFDYHFVPRQVFETMIDDGKFVEYNEHHGNLYGTSKAAIQTGLDAGSDVLLVIDYVGAKNVIKQFPQAVSLFIAPPDRATLINRLLFRGDAKDSIELRLSRMEEEMNEAANFDYVIINTEIDDTMIKVFDIIEKSKITQ